MSDTPERLRTTYAAWNNPPSPGLPEGADVLLRAAVAIERLTADLAEARAEIQNLKQREAKCEELYQEARGLLPHPAGSLPSGVLPSGGTA